MKNERVVGCTGVVHAPRLAGVVHHASVLDVKSVVSLNAAARHASTSPATLKHKRWKKSVFFPTEDFPES